MRHFSSLFLLAAFAAVAPAQTLFDIDFEAGYSPGTLSGQNGWTTSSGDPYVVNNTLGAGGSAQSVRADTTFTANSRYAWQTFSQDYTAANYPTAPLFVAEADVYIEEADVDSWFGIDIWANDATNRSPASISTCPSPSISTTGATKRPQAGNPPRLRR